MSKRQAFTLEFKAQMVLEELSDIKDKGKIYREYWLRPQVFSRWREEFLVNSFSGYGGDVIVGSDGGWWLPVLAERSNIVPPLNYRVKRGPGVEYRLQINAVWQHLQEKEVDAPEELALLEQRNIRYLYIGQQQGRVNYTGPSVLDPASLVNSTTYRPVYHQDRVWVFEVLLSQ